MLWLSLDLGDSTAVEWTSGATLTVTMPKSARLSATGLTDAQLGQVVVNGYHAGIKPDGTIYPMTGMIIVFR